MTRKSWTDGELFTVRRMYPREPKATILKALPDRSWGAIETLACREKIKRRAERSERRIPRNMKPPKNNLLKDLVTRRMQSGLTQQELAEVIGWRGQAAVCQYERGNGISLFMLKAWCDALGLELRAVVVGPAKKTRRSRPTTDAIEAGIKSWVNEQRGLQKRLAA